MSKLDEKPHDRFIEDMQPKSSKLIIYLVIFALSLSLGLSFWFSSFNFFVDRRFAAEEVIIEFDLK
jgi:hypothetical protein